MFVRLNKVLCWSLALCFLCVAQLACRQNSGTKENAAARDASVHVRPLPPDSSPALKSVIDDALEQTRRTLYYDQSYSKISYPGGDVPIERGACTDVVVRAFRKGGVDLQKEVHEDMERAFYAYPTKWGMKGPDPNIDHRRVPNLRTYFERQGRSLTVTSNAEDYLPGDVVTWDLGGGATHIGLVVNLWSDEAHSYLIVHNIGAGVKAENVLFAWPITGHYRYF